MILGGKLDLLLRFLETYGVSIVYSITWFLFIDPIVPEDLSLMVRSRVALLCWKKSFRDAPKIVLLSLAMLLKFEWSTLRAESSKTLSSGEALKFMLFLGLWEPRSPVPDGRPSLSVFYLITVFVRPLRAILPL